MKSQTPKKLPTILGLFLLVTSVALGVFLVQYRQTTQTSASPDEIPASVRITNVSDHSFTVSWITKKQTSGFITYGKSESLGQTAGGGSNSSLHYVQVSDLSPSTTYLFKINSGENLYDSNGNFYKVKTGTTITTSGKTDVIFGNVLTAAGVSSPNTIVYATIAGGAPLSALTDAKGAWVISLSNLRATNLTSILPYSKTTTVDLLAQGGAQTASAKILVSAAKPVPPMTLGKTYNFTDIKVPDSGTLPSSSIQTAAAIQVTPTPTPIPVSATPTPTPTSKPIGGIALTPTPTPTRVATPTPTRAPTPTPTKVATSSAITLPDAGNLTPLLALTIMGLSLFGCGFLLSRLTRA